MVCWALGAGGLCHANRYARTRVTVYPRMCNYHHNPYDRYNWTTEPTSDKCSYVAFGSIYHHNRHNRHRWDPFGRSTFPETEPTPPMPRVRIEQLSPSPPLGELKCGDGFWLHCWG